MPASPEFRKRLESPEGRAAMSAAIVAIKFGMKHAVAAGIDCIPILPSPLPLGAYLKIGMFLLKQLTGFQMKSASSKQTAHDESESKIEVFEDDLFGEENFRVPAGCVHDWTKDEVKSVFGRSMTLETIRAMNLEELQRLSQDPRLQKKKTAYSLWGRAVVLDSLTTKIALNTPQGPPEISPEAKKKMSKQQLEVAELEQQIQMMEILFHWGNRLKEAMSASILLIDEAWVLATEDPKTFGNYARSRLALSAAMIHISFDKNGAGMARAYCRRAIELYPDNIPALGLNEMLSQPKVLLRYKQDTVVGSKAIADAAAKSQSRTVQFGFK